MPDDVVVASNLTPAPSGGDKPWFDSIEIPEVKELMATKGYKDPAAVAHAYWSLNKLHNGAADVIAIPDAKTATAEDWAKVHTALGRPEKADAYQFEFDKNGAQVVDESFVGFAKTAFHEAGLSSKQAQAIVSKWQAFVGERMKASAGGMELEDQRSVDTLKSQLGSEFDNHVASGQKTVKALGLSSRTLGALEQAMGLPASIELMARLGRLVASGGTTLDTPEAARVKIQELLSDKEYQASLRDVRHPQRQENLRRWTELHAQAWPERPKETTPVTPAPVKSTAADELPKDVAAARRELEGLKGNKDFMNSIFETIHKDHARNKGRWNSLQARAWAKTA